MQQRYKISRESEDLKGQQRWMLHLFTIIYRTFKIFRENICCPVDVDDIQSLPGTEISSWSSLILEDCSFASPQKI